MCAAGLVGAGYAYTATTENAGNTVISEYVELSQTGAGAYNFVNNQHIYYNTVNTAADTFTYRLDSPQDLEISSTHYDVVKVGKTFAIHAEKTPSADIADTICIINIDDTAKATLTGGYLLIVKTLSAEDEAAAEYIVYDGSEEKLGQFTIQANSTTAYYDTTVEVFLGYLHETPATAAPADNPLNGAKFTFQIDLGLHNTIEVTGLSINVGQALSAAAYTAKFAGVTLGVTTDFTVTFKDNGVATADSTVAAAGHTYTIVLTGTGDYAGHSAEYDFTATPAP